MSLSLQQVFLALVCWCLWKRSFTEGRDLPFLAEEYLGRLDACSCVPVTHSCTDEFVAIPLLTAHSQPVKVCAQGTRLCCQETAALKTSTFNIVENLNYLLVKVPPGFHRGLLRHLPGYLSGLSRRLAPTQKEVDAGDGDGDDRNIARQEVGDEPEGDAGGSLLERTEDAVTTDDSTSSFIHGDDTVTEWNETEWTKGDELYTRGMENSTLNPIINHTDAYPFTATPESNTHGDMNVLTRTFSLREPPSVSTECFTGTCHEDFPPSNVDVDAAMNMSVGVKATKMSKQTESMFHIDNVTLDNVTQNHTNTSSLTQGQATTPFHKPKQVTTLRQNELMFTSESMTMQHSDTLDQNTTTSSPTQDQSTEPYKQEHVTTPILVHNESVFPSENVTIEHHATQDQTTTFTLEQNVSSSTQEPNMRSNAFILIARVNEPVLYSENETTMEIDSATSTSPSQAPFPNTTPRPDSTATDASTTIHMPPSTTTTTAPTTTTTVNASPGFWEWLFG
ncbi:mucin-5AC-like [Portunus trituberculatus]|uniref:Uncharacterized protein n=1 Tax=Portunus trituberculatus TaxID=210409 RepID=A0A5B7D1B3_PORTR|nr:mucin-5AC-like [Portunus trituberculatus]MPC15105.1 hypothetical protein [Portunus trituberculatus]